MTVTVITTAYNAETTVGGTVDSVLAQDHEDFEYIIVDDGSTDGTAKVLDAIDDDRVRVIHLPYRTGRARALNIAVYEARHSLLANIDADDAMFPTRLRVQLALLEADDTLGMVGGAYVTLDESGSAWVVRPPTDHRDIIRCFPTHFPLCHSAVTYRKEALTEAGGFYPFHRSRIDFDAWVRIVSGTWRCQQSTELVAVHTKYPTSHFALEYSTGRSSVELLARNLSACRELALGRSAYGMSVARFAYSLARPTKPGRKPLYGDVPDDETLQTALKLIQRPSWPAGDDEVAS